MDEHIEIYRDDDYKWRWRHRGANGRVMDQGQSHRRKWNAKRAARRNHPGLPVVVV